MEHSIENVYYVSGLKYSILNVSQICDKENKIKFQSEKCIVTNLVQKDDLTCLSAQSENANRRPSHVRSSLMNKLVCMDLFMTLKFMITMYVMHVSNENKLNQTLV